MAEGNPGTDAELSARAICALPCIFRKSWFSSVAAAFIRKRSMISMAGSYKFQLHNARMRLRDDSKAGSASSSYTFSSVFFAVSLPWGLLQANQPPPVVLRSVRTVQNRSNKPLLSDHPVS